MSSKCCFKCGEVKPLSDFYVHRQMKDGYLNKCKECTKKDMHNDRHGDKRERILAYDRDRASTFNRVQLRKRVVEEWNKKFPERRAAQAKVRYALLKGVLKKMPCSICGSEKSVGHHPDYSEPLSVVWLCQAHHKQLHAQVGNAKQGIQL